LIFWKIGRKNLKNKMKKKFQNLNILLRICYYKKNFPPSIFNKLFDIIAFFSTMISIFLFFLKVVLVEEKLFFWSACILNVIFVFLLARVSWRFLRYHDSCCKKYKLSKKQGFKYSTEIFDRINFEKFYEKFFLLSLTVLSLLLDRDKLAESILSKEFLWLILTATFLVFNFLLLVLAKCIDLIKNFIIKYWTYSFLITNILCLSCIMIVFPIFEYTPKAYELYYYYFGFLISDLLIFFIYIVFFDKSSSDR
jgi:membrane protein